MVAALSIDYSEHNMTGFIDDIFYSNISESQLQSIIVRLLEDSARIQKLERRIEALERMTPGDDEK